MSLFFEHLILLLSLLLTGWMTRNGGRLEEFKEALDEAIVMRAPWAGPMCKRRDDLLHKKQVRRGLPLELRSDHFESLTRSCSVLIDFSIV